MRVESVRSFLTRARLRWYFLRGAGGLALGASVGLALWLLTILAERSGAVGAPPEPFLALGTAGLAIAVGLARALFPRKSLLDVATEVDVRGRWKERVSSLVSLPAVVEPMEHALQEDVGTLLEGRSAAALFPLVVPRKKAWAFGALALLLAAAHLVPPMDLFGGRERIDAGKNQADEVKKTIIRLEKARADLERLNAKPMEKAKAAVKDLEQVSQQLQQEAPDRKKAMAELDKLAEKIKKDKESLDDLKSLSEKLRDAAARAEKEGDMGELGKLLKEGKFQQAAEKLAELREKLGQDGLEPDEKAKLLAEMQKLKDALDKSGEPGKMAEDLAKAMEGLQSDNEQNLAELQESLGTLESSLEELQMLEMTLQELANMQGELAKGEGT